MDKEQMEALLLSILMVNLGAEKKEAQEVAKLIYNVHEEATQKAIREAIVMEVYTPEQIIQACSIVLSVHGKIYIDELILELKRMFLEPKEELDNNEG